MGPEWGELGQKVSRGCGDYELSLSGDNRPTGQTEGPVPIGTGSLSLQTLAWPHRELSSSEAGGMIQEKAGREVLRERVYEWGASGAPAGLCPRTWLVDEVWALSNIALAGSQSRPQTHPEGGGWSLLGGEKEETSANGSQCSFRESSCYSDNDSWAAKT